MSGASEGAGTVQVKAGLSFAGYWPYFNGLGGVSARRKIENKSLFTCILGALHESTEGGSPEPSRAAKFAPDFVLKFSASSGRG
jgi:hypothetical protein